MLYIVRSAGFFIVDAEGEPVELPLGTTVDLTVDEVNSHIQAGHVFALPMPDLSPDSKEEKDGVQ